MKLKYKFILLLFLPLKASSQSPKIDSLYKLLKGNPKNTYALISLAKELRYSNIDTVALIARKILQSGEKDYFCQAYSLLGNYYHSKRKIDSARICYLKSLNTPTTQKPENERIATLITLSNLMYFEGKDKNAIDTLNLVLTELPTIKDISKREEFERKAKGSLADFYKEIGLEDLAIRYYYETIELFHKSNDYNEESAELIGLGKLFFGTKDYSKSIESYKKAIAITLKTENLLYRATAYNVIAYNFIELKQLDSAKLYHAKARDILKNNESASDLLSNKVLHGQILLRENKFKEALVSFNNAVQIAIVHNLESDKFIAYENIGDAYLELNKYDSAYKYFRMSEDYYLNANYTEELKNVRYKLLKSALQRNGDKNSLLLLADFDTAQNMYITNSKIRAIKAQEIKYETALKEATITKQQTEITLQKQRNRWLFIGALGLLVVALVLGLLYRLIRKKNSEIAKQNKIIEGQKAEILHFHDNSLLQLRGMFKRQSAIQLGDNKANEERVRVLALLHEMLHGETDFTGDVNKFLSKLCDLKSRETATPILCNVTGVIKAKPSLLQDIGIMANELITNAVKYSKPLYSGLLIQVNARQVADTIHLQVIDNGQELPANFSPENGSGFGLKYVMDLVKQHDGTFAYHNNNGTTFDIKLTV